MKIIIRQLIKSTISRDLPWKEEDYKDAKFLKAALHALETDSPFQRPK